MPTGEVDETALSSRIDALEQLLSADNKQNTNNVAAPQSARIDALLNRISQLEASIVPLSNNMVNAQLTEQQHRAFEQEDLSLSEKIVSLQSRLARVETIAAKDNSSALLNLKIAELRRKIMTGDAYSAEIEAINTIINNSALKTNAQFNQALEILKEKASVGIPTPRQIQKQFNDLIPELLKAKNIDANASWWQNIMNSMKNIITIRKTDRSSQDDLGIDALIVDIEQWLMTLDIKSALDVVQKLPDEARKMLGTWMDKAESWLRSEQALQNIEKIAGESYLTHDLGNDMQGITP